MKITKTITRMVVKFTAYDKKTRKYDELATEYICGKEPCENALYSFGQKLLGRDKIVMSYEVLELVTDTFQMDAVEFMKAAEIKK